MRLPILSYIKSATVILSVVMILIGWIYAVQSISVIGAIIYLFGLFIDLIDLTIASRKFKSRENVDIPKLPFQRIVRIIEGIVVIGSLIAMIPANNLYRVPGGIIWFGQIGVYILVGPIVSLIAGIPLRMTPGGWKVNRNHRNRK